MPEYLAPGVYVEEISSAPPPIAGVGTSTAGFVGVTSRGPVEGRPQLVTNYGEFARIYGGALRAPTAWAPGWDQLPYAVRGFFANGGRRLYVMRVAPATASAASQALSGGLTTRIVLPVPAATDTIVVPTLLGIHTGSLVQLRMVKNGITTTSASLTVNALDRATNTLTLSADVHATIEFEPRYTTVLTDVASPASTTGRATGTGGAPPWAAAASFQVAASSVGSWGRAVQLAFSHTSAARTVVRHTLVPGGNTRVPVVSAKGFYVGAWVLLDFDDGVTGRIYRQVTAIDGDVLVLSGNNFAAGSLNPVAPLTETVVSTCEFTVNATYTDPVEGGVVTERFDGLTLANVPGRYYVDQLCRSALISVDTSVAVTGTDPMRFPSAPNGSSQTLGSGGSDGTAAPTATEVRGTSLGPNRNTGLLSMEDIDEIAILAAPGVTDGSVQSSLVEQCERLLDRFAVLDPRPTSSGGTPSLQDIQDHAQEFDTKYAAIYYPRIRVTTPFGADPVAIGPSGHIVGLYARVDNTRGVHKAPANEVLRGIVDFEVLVTKAAQEILNPRGINVLRDLRSDRRGLRVYGARTLTSEADWRYVNVRRLFIYVEESLDEGTQWAVFEPNDERLWARIRESVSIFLTGVWKDGALMGTKPEEAFYVVCDRNTMSDDDILNGRLIMEIGIAPVRPAEFVILRIGQWLGGSSRQEL